MRNACHCLDHCCISLESQWSIIALCPSGTYMICSFFLWILRRIYYYSLSKSRDNLNWNSLNDNWGGVCLPDTYIILEEKTTYNVHIHICDEYSGPHSCMMRKKFPLKFRNIFLSFLVTIYIIKVKVLINREIKEGYSNAWWVKYLQEEGPQLLNQFW